MKSSGIYKLNSCLQFNLNAASYVMAKNFNDKMEGKINHKRSHLRVMFLLNEHGEMTAKEICEITHMDKVMISRAVNELLDEKLIKRKVNKDDKRSLFLDLTVKGKRQLSQVIPVMKQWQVDTKKVLGAKKYNQLISLLGEVQSAIQ